MQINVDIIEPEGISVLKAIGTFMTNELSDVVKINRTDNKVTANPGMWLVGKDVFSPENQKHRWLKRNF